MEENGSIEGSFDSEEKKAKYIFDLCDQEGNGFITKNDLLKLKNDLPLSQEQLLSVFEALDVHARGFLTHHEFVSAFKDSKENDLFETKNGEDEYEEGAHDDDSEYYVSEPCTKSDNFDELILSLSQCAMIKDLNTIRSLWSELSAREGGVEAVTSFEALISEVASVVKQTQLQYQALQQSLEKQRLHYNEEMYLMCSEVEASEAGYGVEKEEREKERRMRESLLQQLKEKDQVLQDLKTRQTSLERQYSELNHKKIELSHVIMTSASCNDDDDADGRDTNKGDDNDEFGMNKPESDPVNRKLEKSKSLEVSEWMEQERQHLLCYISQLEKKNKDLQDMQDELEERFLSPKRQSPSSPPVRQRHAKHRLKGADIPAVAIVAPNQSPHHHHGNNKYNNDYNQDCQMFRVVFVGDSGVGKTSLLHRASHGDFDLSLSSTVGVDSQMCSRVVEGCKVVMQMWDTAGQERFRSFSRQYFRRADAVVAAYDVTRPQSFVSLRAWMQHIEEAVEGNTVLVLIGTKLDVLKTCPFPAVSTELGRKLAMEYGASFFETSAMDGHNVEEVVMYLATVLKEHQEKVKVVTTNEVPIKLGPFRKVSEQCCGSFSFK